MMNIMTSNKNQLLVLKISYSWFTLLLFVCMGCVEPYEGVVADYEDVLVVNANITNEEKIQEVNLTRSYRFEEDGPRAEERAIVKIRVDDGDAFLFEEVDPGIYRSTIPFAALPNTNYQLSITTEDDLSYVSEAIQLPATTTIGNLYAELTTNDDGVEGVGIFVDSFDPQANSKYYRFDYEETYKIIAPYWSPYDAVVASEGVTTIDLRVILREREEQVCYGTDSAKSIIIQNTLSSVEDRLNHFNVRFIEKENYILTHRYSILVKQYVQNPEAFAYYETLRGLTKSSENIFSEDQPGFLDGNLYAVDGSGENVAGFFEVSSVDTKRIFFDYEDFFPGEDKPPYINSCYLATPTTTGTLGTRALLNHIYDDDLRFYDYNRSGNAGEGPFYMVSPACGDCTVLGSNQVPEFWID